MDLKIANRAKDYFIEQLQKEREHLLKQVVDSIQREGQLEAQLLQLGDTPKMSRQTQRTTEPTP